MSVKISPPVRKVPRPSSLAPLQKIDLTTSHSPAKTTDPVAPLKEERNRVERSCAVVLAVTRLAKVVLHERVNKHKTYGREDDEAILYYHAERRRIYKTTFVGVSLLLNSTGMPVIFKICILIFLIVRFSTGS